MGKKLVEIFIISLLLTIIHGFFVKAPDIHVRIVGGNPTTIEKFPYQVSIMYIDSHICGGSLIYPQFVLTAAHCTDNMSEKYLLVRAGSTYIDQSGVVKTITKIYKHPDYNADTLNNDIAIIKLDSAYTLSPNIQVVALPEQNESITENQIGVATGWGRLSYNGAIPLELQEVQLPTLTSANCESVYYERITDTMFCAGYMEVGKDTCGGDSGGPYVISERLVGITSWGDGCATLNSPGVYTKVSIFVNYIHSLVDNK